MSLTVKYGLRPGTLKGELFRVLLEEGIHGLKVSELAKSLQKVEEFQSDTEDSGAVDDGVGDSADLYEPWQSKDNMVIVYTEIDESHPGEVWLLGLMEGKYSDLSIEEKLSAIVAPIDLLHGH
ncbi:hypothetical protein CerSpe_106140 [Prunus speciosa]